MDTQGRYDVVIVGGGVSGLSAALVLGRARRNVVVIDAGTPRNAPADAAYGFVTRDGTAPGQLVALARQDLAPYGVEFLDAGAETAREVTEGWSVTTADGRSVEGRHLVLATGLRDVLPAVPGAREAWGRGLLQCPYCHGWEVRDQPLGVLGSSPASLDQALLVRQWSPDVTFFPHTLEPLSTDGERRLRARGVRIAEGRVEGLVLEDGDDDAPRALRGVRLEDGTVQPCTAVFCEPAADAALPLIDDLGCEMRDDGCVATNDIGRTSVDGVWAVGNAADPAAQLVPAAGDAYRVAVAVNAMLVQADCAACLDAEEAVSGGI
ncbi:NAD(P)/FAD-dependent oxidoreductase [Arthrobacter agilis]|jgi:thioredoxin reductase|uniref:NAD(P)/FAD-dependent oxidoreductase n=1 Tax=Arthrobacter agilis TaxID=37921 RepID=UPI00278A4939|nr:NAD(P)/FAD-dependent oxidoreductase [Arthrobacter agilis]MDQ0736291.1 thioredoxin reductase [Arthrobacter agilis]